MLTCKEIYDKAYDEAINKVLTILRKYDADPEDRTKYSIKCFKDIKGLMKND